jgi:hypothetical protein
MVKKLFSWELALGIFLLSYGLGFGLWYRGSSSDSFPRFFLEAGLCLIFCFVWSLTALWLNDSFNKPRQVYSNSNRVLRKSRSARLSGESSSAQSDVPSPPRRRRRRNKKLRKVLATCCALLFALSTYRIFTSYRTMVAERNTAVIEVFVADSQRTKASKVPFRTTPGEQKEMMFSIFDVPYKEVSIHEDKDGNKTIHLNIILRNTGAAPVGDPYVKIDSNAPIQAGDDQTFAISSTEVGSHMFDIPPTKDPSEEVVMPVIISIAEYQFETGVLVSVVGQNLKPYAAAIKLRVVDRTGPDSPPAAAKR